MSEQPKTKLIRCPKCGAEWETLDKGKPPECSGPAYPNEHPWTQMIDVPISAQSADV